jgi:hypothetical protein
VPGGEDNSDMGEPGARGVGGGKAEGEDDEDVVRGARARGGDGGGVGGGVQGGEDKCEIGVPGILGGVGVDTRDIRVGDSGGVEGGVGGGVKGGEEIGETEDDKDELGGENEEGAGGNGGRCRGAELKHPFPLVGEEDGLGVGEEKAEALPE